MPEHLKTLYLLSMDSSNYFRQHWYWWGEAHYRTSGKLGLTAIPAEEWATVQTAAETFWDEIAAESERKAEVVQILKDYTAVMNKAGAPTATPESVPAASLPEGTGRREAVPVLEELRAVVDRRTARVPRVQPTARWAVDSRRRAGPVSASPPSPRHSCCRSCPAAPSAPAGRPSSAARGKAADVHGVAQLLQLLAQPGRPAASSCADLAAVLQHLACRWPSRPGATSPIVAQTRGLGIVRGDEPAAALDEGAKIEEEGRGLGPASASRTPRAPGRGGSPAPRRARRAPRGRGRAAPRRRRPRSIRTSASRSSPPPGPAAARSSPGRHRRLAEARAEDRERGPEPAEADAELVRPLDGGAVGDHGHVDGDLPEAVAQDVARRRLHRFPGSKLGAPALRGRAGASAAPVRARR